MASRQKGQLYEVYASKGLFGRLASTLPKLGSTRRLNNQPSIGKKPRKLPKAPNIAPEDAINADGDEFIFDGTDREMRDPRKFARTGIRKLAGKVPSGRRSGAGPVRKQGVKEFGTPETRKLARDIVKRKFRPLRTRKTGDIFTEDDLAPHMAVADYVRAANAEGRVGRLIQRQLDAFMLLSPEQRKERLLGSLRSAVGYDKDNKKQVGKILEEIFELEKMKIRTDEKTHRQMSNILENAIADSPAFRRIVEERGLPAITVIDELSERLLKEFYDDQGYERPKDRLGDAASAFAAGDIVYFVGNSWDDWHTASGSRRGDSLNEDEQMLENYSITPESTLRHEYGHIVTHRILTSGSKEEYDAWGDINAEYYKTAGPWFYVQEMHNNIAMEYGEAAADRWMRTEVDPSMIPATEDIWWSQYAGTNEDEFFAELFSMATSPNEAIRNRVPQKMRDKLTIILGFNPWEEFENG